MHVHGWTPSRTQHSDPYATRWYPSILEYQLHVTGNTAGAAVTLRSKD